MEHTLLKFRWNYLAISRTDFKEDIALMGAFCFVCVAVVFNILEENIGI